MKAHNEFKTVAVIGCGFIGHSWGVVFARSGLNVRMYNRRSATLDTVRERMTEALEFLASEQVVDRNEIPGIMARVMTTDDLEEAVDGADYIQECLWEDIDIKRDIFVRLTEITSEEIPIGSSCSGLRISDIVRDVKNHPERCMVAHPTNPPHLIPFMEISGDNASQEMKDTVFRFFESIGQRPVQCSEIYGYVLNRLQLSLVQEALWLVQNDVCSVQAVERALTDGLGLRWAFTGPYGVEELNSADLREGLAKYKDYMIEFFNKEQEKVRDYDKKFIEKCVKGFSPEMRGMDHDDYLHWRDQMVTRTRKIKGDFEVE